mgnify:CR=1 FL=1
MNIVKLTLCTIVTLVSASTFIGDSRSTRPEGELEADDSGTQEQTNVMISFPWSKTNVTQEYTYVACDSESEVELNGSSTDIRAAP